MRVLSKIGLTVFTIIAFGLLNQVLTNGNRMPFLLSIIIIVVIYLIWTYKPKNLNELTKNEADKLVVEYSTILKDFNKSGYVINEIKTVSQDINNNHWKVVIIINGETWELDKFCEKFEYSLPKI